MSYKTYAEAKIANPDSEIVTTGKDWDYEKETIGTFEVRVFDGDDDGAHFIGDEAWVICNPADYCSTLKKFLEDGFKLVEGDIVMTINCSISVVKEGAVDAWNFRGVNDNGFFILSAAVINGGCKIPANSEQWTIYNNTMPLHELTDEQVGKLVKHSGCVEHMNPNSGEWGATITPMWNRAGVYRIKQKSEREMFIEAAIGHGIKPETQNPKQIFGELFDSGKFKYIDLTQHFGENI